MDKEQQAGFTCRIKRSDIEATGKSLPWRMLGWLGCGCIGLIGIMIVLWATGAIVFDLPVHPLFRRIIAVMFLVVALFFGFFGKGKLRLVAPAMVLAVACWWFTLKPSNERDWMPDVAKTGWAEIDGNLVTLHNVRNCDYRTETNYTARWETRTVDLSHLTGIDMAINYWGSPYMAHPIISFQFSDAPPVCFSIETRKEKGESYSAVGGIYRQYELIYIVADERDVIRVRTNYRKVEDIYLYRLNIPLEKARERFMEYVTTLNNLKDHPRWYNAVTNNCTTSIRTQHGKSRRPWDWRILVNGMADEMLYENGAFAGGKMPFAELKKRSLINKPALEANDSPDFSARIRANAPSFSETTTPPDP